MCLGKERSWMVERLGWGSDGCEEGNGDFEEHFL